MHLTYPMIPIAPVRASHYLMHEPYGMFLFAYTLLWLIQANTETMHAFPPSAERAPVDVIVLGDIVLVQGGGLARFQLAVHKMHPPSAQLR